MQVIANSNIPSPLVLLFEHQISALQQHALSRLPALVDPNQGSLSDPRTATQVPNMHAPFDLHHLEFAVQIIAYLFWFWSIFDLLGSVSDYFRAQYGACCFVRTFNRSYSIIRLIWKMSKKHALNRI